MIILPGQRIELADSGETVQTFRGWIGTRKYRVNQADKIWLAPRIGEPFANDMPWLQCVSVRRKPVKEATSETFNETTYVDIIAEYSTQITKSKTRERLNISTRALTTTKGKVWTSDGVACDQTNSIVYPVCEWILSVEQPVIPKDLVFALAGKLNSKFFANCPPGFLLFEGACTREGTDDSGFTAYDTDYSFVYQGRSFNEVWREDIGDYDTFTTPNYGSADFNLLGLDLTI